MLPIFNVMVLLAGLLNALEVVGKRLDTARIAMIGMGAANVATSSMIVVLKGLFATSVLKKLEVACSPFACV